jgi:hypothetical protein
MTKDEIKRRLRQTLQQHLSAPPGLVQGLVPPAVTDGKLYEAYVPSLVVKHLVVDEGYDLRLVGGTKLQLKSAPGPINRTYPYIELRRNGRCVAELWTDVEFCALSCWARQCPPTTKGDFHELDVVVVTAGQNGRPPHDSIWLAAECKNTDYQKGFLKEILGIRRELSLLDDWTSTRFNKWPRNTVRARPPSCLLVYSSDRKVLEYSAPGDFFGIDFFYEPM